MRDNELIALIISTILAGEEVAGIPGLPIKQAFQPTQQGVNSRPTAYLYKVGPDKRFGFPYRSDIWDLEAGEMVHEELQKYESLFQISVLATQDPAVTTGYTASDILNLIAAILQSDTAIQTFQNNNVGILRISTVRNTPFIDDRGRHEYEPSLDFSLMHNQVVTSTVPVIQSTEIDIFSV